MPDIESLEERVKSRVFKIADILQSCEEPSLFKGSIGQAVFYSLAGQCFGVESFSYKSEQIFFLSIQQLNKISRNYTFCNGVAGYLWGVRQLNHKKSSLLAQEFVSLHEQLIEYCLSSARRNNFDFLHGSSGVLFYLLEMNVIDEKDINSWLGHLFASAEKNKLFYRWKSRIYFPSDKVVYNLSLSHGISSIIILLSEILNRFSGNSLAEELLHGSVNYLLSTECLSEEGSLFPDYIGNDGAVYSSRLAWCYGDLGNAAALWRAGTTLKNDCMRQKAINILLHSAKRLTFKDEYISDICFCHGTAGVAHIFNRFYNETKIEPFKNAGCFWVDKTLQLARKTQVPGNYEYSLIDGQTGVGLVLLSFLTSNFDWDRCLLLP